LKSIRVDIEPDESAGGTISVDEDPHAIKGEKRTKKDWKAKNEQLACEIEDELDLVLKEKYGMEGNAPLHGRLVQDFKWPDDARSNLNPIDPYIVGLRSTPAKPGDTLFDIKTVSLSTPKGKVVPVT
jgi:hypothetical protein